MPMAIPILRYLRLRRPDSSTKTGRSDPSPPAPVPLLPPASACWAGPSSWTVTSSGSAAPAPAPVPVSGDAPQGSARIPAPTADTSLPAGGSGHPVRIRRPSLVVRRLSLPTCRPSVPPCRPSVPIFRPTLAACLPPSRISGPLFSPAAPVASVSENAASASPPMTGTSLVADAAWGHSGWASSRHFSMRTHIPPQDCSGCANDPEHTPPNRAPTRSSRPPYHTVLRP